MKHLLFGLVALLALATSAGMAETLVNLEEAAEVSQLNLRIDGSGGSRIYARICDYCELLALRADSNTRIERNRQRISLSQAAALKNKGATVLFDPATLQVTRIIYWN